MRNNNRRNTSGNELIADISNSSNSSNTAVLQVSVVLNTATGQLLLQQPMNSTVNISKLIAEDSKFANFVAVSDECLNSLEPNYNATTTITSPSPALCLDTMGEGITTWCGLEEYHEEKCRYVSSVNQLYQMTAMGMMI